MEGTTTNLEGRVSTVHQRVTPPGTAQADWIIAAELAFQLGSDLGLESVAQIQAELASVSPVHAGLLEALAAGSLDAEGVVFAGSQVTFVPPAPADSPGHDAYSLRLVAFLAGDRASYITGASIDVAGGMGRYV